MDCEGLSFSFFFCFVLIVEGSILRSESYWKGEWCSVYTMGVLYNGLYLLSMALNAVHIVP